MKIEQIIQALENLASTKKDSKLKLVDINNFFDAFKTSSEDQIKVINALEDKGFVETPKGFASMSALQLKIHRFINESLLGQLIKHRKATLVVTEEDLKSLLEEDEGIYYVLNKKGDLIKPSCNNTNITQARRVKKAKEQMDQLNK